MTKRSKLTIGLATFCLSLTVLGGLASLTKGFTDFTFSPDSEEALTVTPIENIRFLSVTDSVEEDGSLRKEILYEIHPASAADEKFSCLLDWSTLPDAGKESEDWSAGRNAEDYVTYEVTEENCRIAFTCHQAFGHQLAFVMTSVSNPSIQARLTLDYRRKLLSNARVETTPVYDPGKPIRIDVVPEVYSVGTTGQKASTLRPTIVVDYRDRGIPFDSLFEPIVTTGIASENYKYLGNSYSSAADLLLDMKEKVHDYLCRIPSAEGIDTFDLTVFSSYLTYSYHAYTTYKDVYQESRASLNAFIRRYKEAYAAGSGFYLEVDCEGKARYESLIDMNLSPSSLTGLSFSEDNIEF